MSIEPNDPTSPYDDGERLDRLYYGEGLTVGEIAESLGCGSGTVRRYVDKYGIERRKRGGNTHRPPHYRTTKQGYEVWNHGWEDDQYTVKVHRLQAVAHFGFDAVAGRNVHHKSGIPWDNRVENFELLTHSEHRSLHASGRFDPQEGPV